MGGVGVKAQALALVYDVHMDYDELVGIKAQVPSPVDFMCRDWVKVLLPVHAGFTQQLVTFMCVDYYASEYNKVIGDLNENDYRDDQSSNPINKRVMFLCT